MCGPLPPPSTTGPSSCWRFGPDRSRLASPSSPHLGIDPDKDFTLAPHLQHLDPTRPPTVFGRAYASLATTSVAKFTSRHVNWKIDPLLLRITRGRLATTLVFPTALLETQGARSGARRRNAIIYFHDEDRITIGASNAGAPRHPAWYHNLQAHPDVTLGGLPMRATVVDDEPERIRLWALADRVFPAYARYRQDAAKANRTIPLIQLTQRARAETPLNMLDQALPGEPPPSPTAETGR